MGCINSKKIDNKKTVEAIELDDIKIYISTKNIKNNIFDIYEIPYTGPDSIF